MSVFGEINYSVVAENVVPIHQPKPSTRRFLNFKNLKRLGHGVLGAVTTVTTKAGEKIHLSTSIQECCGWCA